MYLFGSRVVGPQRVKELNQQQASAQHLQARAPAMLLYHTSVAYSWLPTCTPLLSHTVVICSHIHEHLNHSFVFLLYSVVSFLLNNPGITLLGCMGHGTVWEQETGK